MNERIRKLAINCATHKDWDNPAVDPTEYTFSPSDVEKFAQLIVQECANIDFRARVGLSHESDYEVSKAIRDHFGVEE